MTRREIERVAAAVKELGKHGVITAPHVSLVIGRAVLGTGRDKLEPWKKWLVAVGWPASLIPEVARMEAFHNMAGKQVEP